MRRESFSTTHCPVVRLLIVGETVDEIVRTRDALLRHPGIHVHGVRDAAEAAAMAARSAPDAVLVDIERWDGTGLSLVRPGGGSRRTPAIVIYGPGDEARVAEAMASGASGAIERRVFSDGDAVVRRVSDTLAAVRAARRRETMALWLEREARFDHLTGLSNRDAFEGRIGEVAGDQSSVGDPVSVIAMGIEGLGVVNRVFGHGVGDELLRRAAGAAARCIRAGGVAARVGGDELAILVPGSRMGIAQMLACRIGHEVERLNSGPDELPALTVTFSVASGRTTEAPALFATAMEQLGGGSRTKAPVLAPVSWAGAGGGPGVA